MLTLMSLPDTGHSVPAAITDAAFLTVLIAPFLWLAVIKPLRGTAITASVRASHIVDHALDGIITLDEKGNLESINPAGERLFGYRAKELTGRHISTIIPRLDNASPAAYLDKRCRTETSGGPDMDGELSGRRRDGTAFSIDLALSSITLGNRKLFTGILRDITERKKTEDTLRKAKEFVETVLNSMSDAISIIDVRDHTIVGVNNVFLKEVGLPEEEVLGKPCYRVTHHRSTPCVPPDDTCPLTEALATGRPATAEHVHYNDNGETVYVEITTSPIRAADGGIIQVVHVARDVTERRLTEKELQLYNEKLKRSNRELQDFLHIASHDLQEPLRKIQTFGERLKSTCDASLGENGRDYLERMQGAAGRMQNLIESLLGFSRLTTRAQPFVPVDLDQVIREVVADLRETIDGLGGRIETGRLLTIDADAVQMRQLLHNLIDNALKFHRQDRPPVVTISATCIAAASQRRDADGSDSLCQITIRDNGIGFDEKYAKRIFGVFQRLHGRSEYEGTGVGLSICRKIVERHHGAITARATPGRGAVFTVTLPVNQSPAPARDAGN